MQDKMGGKESTTNASHREHAAGLTAIGKRTLVEAISVPEPEHGLPLQRKAGGEPAPNGVTPTNIAREGTEGPSGPLPHHDRIQAAFGRHDISGVSAHEDEAASEASRALGARAYAHGNAVAFASSPDLHTAAHEAAHVVQQRGGVQLADGIDRPGDRYERHADAVADAVVAGRSAESLLDQMAPGSTSGGHAAAVQRISDDKWLADHLADAKAADPATAPTDESRMFVDPDPDAGTTAPIQTEVHFVAGHTTRRALVIGGVHGSEPEGEVVVRQLIEALAEEGEDQAVLHGGPRAEVDRQIAPGSEPEEPQRAAPRGR